MAKVLSRLDILLHANTANYTRDVKRATDQTKKELKTLADYGKTVGSSLGMAFAALGSAVSVSHIVQTADHMQSLASKVRLATSSMDEYKAVQEQLRVISNAQKSSFEGVVDLYSSSHRALSQLGKTQQDVINFTKNMTMAMNIGGGSAQAQSAALAQLGQALASGALRGDEFNSVAEQAPILLDLVAKEIGVATGALRSLAAEGVITSDVVYNAVVGATDSLTTMSAKMPTTFSQGVQVIKNEYNYLIDDIMNQNSLLSQNLANVALWTAEHFRTLVGVGVTLGAVWLANVAKNSALVTSFVGLTGATLANTKASIANAFSVQGQIAAYNTLSSRLMLLRLTKAHYLDITKTAIATTTAYARSLVGLAGSFNTATAAARLHTLALAGVTTAKRTAMGVGILATRAVTGLGTAFMSLGRIIAAHPIITLTAVIGAVIARTEGLGGAVKSLGDAFSVAGVLAVDFVGGVVDGLNMAWTATANYFDGLMGGSANATGFAQTAFGGFFAGTHKGFVGVLQITARVFDLAGATIVTFAQYAWKNISSLGTAIVNVFKGIGNFIASVFENLINNQIGKINVIIDAMNAISGMFGGGQVARLGQVSIGRMNYGSTDFGVGGFSASIAQNNAHALETKVVNAYEQVQQSANRANGANLGLAGAMADVGKASDKASSGTKKAADANKLAKKTADEASKALKELEDNFKSQLAEWERAEWDMSTPFVSELSKIEFEITSVSGKFHIASDEMKADLRKLAREMDTAKANFELFGTYTDATRQINLLSSKGGKYLEMAYDLQDTANALQLAGEEQKKQILTTMANLDAATKAWEIQDKFLENQKELIALGITDGMTRDLLLIDQERADTLEKYNYLLKDGYAEQFALVEQQANALAQQQKQIVITKQYNDLVQSLKTDEEQHLDTLKSQLDILKAHNQVMGANLDIERAKKLISQNVGLATPTDHYKELNDKTTSQYASLDTGLQALLDNERLTEEERINIKAWGAEERLKIEKAHSLAINSLILSDSESMFGSLASIAKDGLGEQSKLYRAMFAMQQGFAIAQAGIAMQQAISQGLAKGFPLGLPDMALAVSHGAKIVSAIKSVVMPIGQAHDGIMSVPKSGTWNLEKGERVLPKHTAQNLDNTLNRLQGGGQVVNISVTVNADGGDVQSSHELGKGLGNAIKLAVQAELQKECRQGGMLYGR